VDSTPQPLSDLSHLNELKSGGGCLFITGKAGTGKSTLLREFVRFSGLKCAVLAPTGLAAINVGGQTIHSFFRIKPGPVVSTDEHVPVFSPGHPRARVIRAMDVLIIDEVSMVRADLMDAIDYSLRRNTRIDEPFGGKKVLFFGDLLQLEPVVRRGAEMEMILDLYASPFFFDSKVLRNYPMDVLELTTVHRQADDPEFLWALNELRKGNCEMLENFNSRVHAPVQADRVITLNPRNAGVLAMNMQKLQDLGSQEKVYKGITTGDFIDEYPTDPQLALRRGARVMFVKNGSEWVNGTLGTVVELRDSTVLVQKDDGQDVEVAPESWEKTVYTWDSRSHSIVGQVVGTFVQIPLKLAWALTVHKSQGLTFDAVRLDFGSRAFAHGQLYVALSRCRTLAGLTLASPLKPQDLVVNERVVEFWGQMRLT
jgi:hypothetical protein